jgi:diaminopropionate ammonia-lyase
MDLLLRNPGRDPAWRPPPREDPGALHRTLPGYAPTPLHSAPALAAELGVAEVLLKDEAERFGLPSFKALGAWWASACALADRLGEPALRTDLAGLRARAPELGDLALVCATDGNHGRAVARFAALVGVSAEIHVPAGMAAPRRAAIAAEGARVVVVDGSYDDAVARSAERGAAPGALVVSDTSWPGYEDIPARVIEGYATLFAEIDAAPDIAFVPVGVGALAAAAAAGLPASTRLVSVEPLAAACTIASARAGRPVGFPGPHHTAMAGLACGIPSPVAWPAVAARFDAFCAIEEETADEGVRRLSALGLDRGECSGATVGAALELLRRDDARAALGAGPGSSVLLLLTEGVTDPERFARIAPRRGPAAPGRRR